MIVNEVDVVRAVDKGRCFQYVNQEADVGLDTADTEFFQDAQHLLDSTFVRQRVCRSFDQQGIIIRSNNCARISIAAVKTNAEAAAAAVYHDFTGIRHKVVHRIFCRNTALNGVTQAANVFLRFDADFVAVQCVAFSDFNLRLYNIDACNHFCYSMFNLYTRVDFDKVELAVRRNQKFNRAGVDVFDIFHELDGCIANIFTKLLRQSKCRCNFYDFLMTTLYGTVAFV